MASKPSFLVPVTRSLKGQLEQTIQKRLGQERRGQGFGENYKPYLTVRDVPSKGRVHRRPSLTHNRVVHLLSDLELAVFLLLDWQENVLDIREQFPLNQEKTLEIARRLGIKHPSYQGVDQVVTTDLLIDLEINGSHINHAISIKYAQDLEDKRNIEKLEIERRYWENEGIDWYIFTEHEIPTKTIKNIRWLAAHTYNYELDAETRISVFEKIVQAIDVQPYIKLADILKLVDSREELRSGTYLQYFRHLAAQNAFHWDMGDRLHTLLKGEDIKASKHWLERNVNYVCAQ